MSTRSPFAAVVAVAVALGAGGCVIPALSGEIDARSREALEFVEEASPQALMEGEGVFTGTVERGGARWLRFEFPGVLAGDGARFLVVLVSEDAVEGSRRLLVTDTDGPAPARAPARLLLYRRGTCDFGAFTPANHPREHLLCLRILEDEESCVADGGWMPPEPDRAGEGWQRASGEVDFGWVTRSRAGVAGLYALYPFALLADIVIVPAVALLILMCPQSCF